MTQIYQKDLLLILTETSDHSFPSKTIKSKQVIFKKKMSKLIAHFQK
jgi:hypothetical protein